MVMVGHQTITDDTDVETTAVFFNQSDQIAIIFRIREDRRSVHSAIKNVVQLSLVESIVS